MGLQVGSLGNPGWTADDLTNWELLRAIEAVAAAYFGI